MRREGAGGRRRRKMLRKQRCRRQLHPVLYLCPRHLFTNLLKHKCDTAAVVSKSQGTLVNFKNSFLEELISIGFHQLQWSMDGLLEQNDIECLRNTMLRQEEIFKQQVHELHLLYRVQKLLMAELGTKEAKFHSVATADTPTTTKETKIRYWSGTSTSETSHSSYISNRPLSTPHSNSEYNSLRQFSTLAEDYPTKQIGSDRGQPVKEENSISLDRSKDAWVEEECDVELTLSIGCGSGKKKPEHWLQPEPDPRDMRQQALSTMPVRAERGGVQ